MTTYYSGMVENYVNQIPYAEDILRTNLYTMIAISNLARSVLIGQGTVSNLVSGLTCTPVSPPGLSVVLGPGCIYSLQSLLPLQYGGIFGPDITTDHEQYKQCLLTDSVILSTPAPAGVGNSIIYLIQCQDVNTQGNPSTNRPYYNSANPAVPTYLSAADTYVEVFTTNVKAGTASPSPVAPSPDAGFTPLYYVHVANGQTSIISGDISIAANAPFINTTLSNAATITGVQNKSYTFCTDTGSANAYVATLSPAPTAYNSGLTIYLKVSATNTTNSFINVNGLGSKNIVLANGTTLPAGAMLANQIAILQFDGTNFQLQNPINSITNLIPTGTLLSFGATTVPAGFLACDGTAVSRTTYAILFAIIGTTWGTGDGSTTFNLPSFVDKVPMGSGTNAVGQTVGANSHSISSTELPVHNHTFNNNNGDIPVATAGSFIDEPFSNGAGPGYAAVVNPPPIFSVSSTDNAGSSTSMSLVQLSAVVKVIIKY